MSLSNGLVERRLLPVATERLQDDPVVLLEGPRSVGKSTLLQELAETMGAVLLDLDVPAPRTRNRPGLMAEARGGWDERLG